VEEMNMQMLRLLTDTATTQDSTMMLIMNFVPLILIFVVFYFILIRPQRKKDKETQKMRSNVQVGDEIVTIGGVIGIVVSLKEDTVVIETAGERNKIRIKRWAIQSNETIHDDV
jgi:preprotein translocase subunit YajC